MPALSAFGIASAVLQIVTLVGLITIAASTYMITYSHQLYDLLEPLLAPFERGRPSGEEDRWQPRGGG